MISAKFFTVFAGLAGSIGIALSAAAAHNADLPNLGTAANMLLFHAPVFLVLGLSNGNKVQNIAGLTLAIRAVVFYL